MAPINKKQHYLPAGFLKRFSAHPENGRKAMVWAFDGKKSFQKSVENLCAGKDFYTSGATSEDLPSERIREQSMHGPLDDRLPVLVSELLGGKCSDKHQFEMHFQASFLLFRGPGFKNDTSGLTLDAVQKGGYFLETVLGVEASNEDGRNREWFFNRAYRIALAEWQYAVVTPSGASPDFDLVCGDIPVVMLGDADSRHLTMLPLSPSHLFVAARKQVYRIQPQHYSEADAGNLNGIQAKLAHRFVFSREELPEVDQGSAARIMSARERPWSMGVIEDSRTGSRTMTFTGGLPSFLKLVSPE